MKSEQINAEFVSSFIEECVALELTTPDQICSEARKRIAEVDEQVKYRIKLSDVLSMFKDIETPQEKKQVRNQIVNEIDAKLAKEVIEIIGGRELKIKDLSKFFESFSDNYRRDLIYTTKCMIENKILQRKEAGEIVFGDKYSDFCNTNVSSQ